MFELMFTSFPAVFRYMQLRRRGEAMTVWNMKTAIFLWAVLAFGLFLTIFYYHPKTYAGIVPFRTVSVVAQTAGPVTEIPVSNEQRVEAGDLLFRIEDSAQKAALQEAEAQLALIDVAESKAKDTIIVAEASVTKAEAELDKLRDDLKDAQTLVERGVSKTDAVLDVQTSIAKTESDLTAAKAQLDLAQIEIDENIPAQRKAAEAAVASAKVALSYTEVRSFTGGTVTQLALNVGSPATTLILRPAMIIIPDRQEGVPIRIAAGFSQVARDTLYEDMPVEVACDSNANLLFKDTILPARISSIQPAVAAGQIVPNGALKDLKFATARGTIQALIELKHKEHEMALLDGSGCIVQAYSNNIEGFFGHVISITGVVKAAGLRMKVLGALITGVGLAGGGH